MISNNYKQSNIGDNMSNKETKIITKKLRTGSLEFFINKYEELLSLGWKKVTRAIDDEFTYRVSMEKEVYLDSTEPRIAYENCRPAKGTECPILTDMEGIVATPLRVEDCDVQPKAIETLSPPNDVPVKAALESKEALEEVVTETEEPLTDLSSTTVFEHRPYTTEEVAAMSWQDVMKLAAILDAGIGPRPKRAANVVIQSAKQWGNQ